MFTNALTLLMSFALFGVAFAEDIVAKGHGDAWQYGTGGGVVGLIVLILDIIVFCMIASLPFHISQVKWDTNKTTSGASQI